MKKRFKVRKQRMRVKALKIMKNLFLLAEMNFDIHPEGSHRYVELIRRISMRCRVRIPKEVKRRYCKHCHKFLHPQKNSRVRTRKGKLVIKCLECGGYMRQPFFRERKERRKRRFLRRIENTGR
ncbi:MAG: ribonuclease P protein component 4 [Candidatus Methanofastidiosia archaeon]